MGGFGGAFLNVSGFRCKKRAYQNMEFEKLKTFP